jgi:aspartate aminotransferase
MSPKNNHPFINLNLNVRGLANSATLSINEKSNLLKKQGKQIYKLGLGQSPFPVPKPVVSALKENAYQKDYLPVKGLYPLREAVAEYYGRSQKLNFSAEDILIGPGSKELMFLLQLVYYGDLVIPIPSWVSYAPQAHIIGRHVRWLKTREENKWKLTPDELLNHCKDDPDKPRIVILNYPSNPSGVTYTVEELKKIASIAKRYKIILLSDEIYGELNHKNKHVSIAKFYKEGTIISGGLSKWCGAGGWRLGVFAFPSSLRWLMDAMSAVASETFTSTSAPIQYAAVRAFQGGEEIEKYLTNSRLILRILAGEIIKKLHKANIKVPQPDGAFYVFADFSNYSEVLAERGIYNGHQLCDKLVEDTGVAILPGSAFGMQSDDLVARIAYVDFDGTKIISSTEKLKSQFEIDKEFIYKYCGNTLEAIDLICGWLKNL